mmetsp:Transcript_110999/g.324684  ORF Transcript_110999/g.324684 Transcript_110999/m.324684 type:complete len:226 (+) Transcript_110999:59-736(+)
MCVRGTSSSACCQVPLSSTRGKRTFKSSSDYDGHRAWTRRVGTKAAEATVPHATGVAAQARELRRKLTALVVKVARLREACADRRGSRAASGRGVGAVFVAWEVVLEAAEAAVLAHATRIAAEPSPARGVGTASLIVHAELLAVFAARSLRHGGARKRRWPHGHIWHVCCATLGNAGVTLGNAGVTHGDGRVTHGDGRVTQGDGRSRCGKYAARTDIGKLRCIHQ